MYNVEKVEALKYWREHQNSVHNLMDNELATLMSISESAIINYLESKVVNPSMQHFFRLQADNIPMILISIQHQVCSPKVDLENRANLFATIETSALFTVSLLISWFIMQFMISEAIKISFLIMGENNGMVFIIYSGLKFFKRISVPVRTQH